MINGCPESSDELIFPKGKNKDRKHGQREGHTMSERMRKNQTIFRKI